MMVVEGVVDVVYELEFSLYDMVVFDVIVIEVGGKFIGFDGKDGLWFGNVLVLNGFFYD